MEKFLASAVQMRAGNDTEANLTVAERLITEAATGGAKLIVLPEVFAWRGPTDQEREIAETIPGKLSDRIADLARKLGVFIVAGSLLEKPSGGVGLPFNTAALFGPRGEMLAKYRKVHMFDVELENGLGVRESHSRSGSTEVVCVDTELGRIGLAICYDLRFPELFRRLADDGVEIIVVPSAFTRETGRAHWHLLVRARAVENQCYVIAPNQHGENEKGFAEFGHSIIVDPWGEVIAEASSDRNEHISAILDADRLERIRKKLPCLEHRKL